jgi:hypothetical protein
MIRSLISQLSRQCVEVPATLETLFSSCENGQRHSPLDDFLEVLQQILRGFPQSYIILDALDECTTRAELMGILEIMTGWRLEKLHILVTSRRERDIESSLEDFVDKQHTICLQSELVDKDIHTYIRQRLSEDKNLKKWQKDHEIRQEIETALVNGAHGMYLFLFSLVSRSNADDYGQVSVGCVPAGCIRRLLQSVNAAEIPGNATANAR